MVSVSQDHLLPQVVQAILVIFEQGPQQVARSSGFIQRQSPTSGLTAGSFVQMLVGGWLSKADSSLDELVQYGADTGITLTPQGLHQRFTPQAVVLLRQVFELAIAQVVVADPVAIPLVERFGGILLEDSSSVRLPDELRGVFVGCGGSNGGRKTSSAFKVFVRLDMLRGHLQCSRLVDGRHADSQTPFKERPNAERTLHVRDRGFVDLLRWGREVERGDDVLSYYKAGMHVLDPERHLIDLCEWLASLDGSTAEREVLVGVQARLPMRLLVERLPQEQRQARIEHLRQEASKHGRSLSPCSEQLAGWTLILTTASAERLSLSEALVVLRLRWQLELLFKLWKEDGQLDCWRSENVERIQCEIYAKLIGLLLQHWVVIVGCWHEPHRSMVKAAKAVQNRAILLAVALTGGMLLLEAVKRMQRATQHGSRLNTRRAAPNTSQMLMTGINIWDERPHTPKKRGRKKLSNS